MPVVPCTKPPLPRFILSTYPELGLQFVLCLTTDIPDQYMWTNPKVWSLAVAETVAWAGIFYLFPAMLVRWESHFGWSRVDLVVGFTAALATVGS